MHNEFDNDINALGREIAALKQERQKSASVLRTERVLYGLTFNLEIAGMMATYVRSDKMAIIDIDTDGNNPLVGVSFDVNDLDDRTIRSVPIYNENTGHIGYMVYILSNNSDDISTLAGGGSVTLGYDINISTTTEITTTITYEDLWVD